MFWLKTSIIAWWLLIEIAHATNHALLIAGKSRIDRRPQNDVAVVNEFLLRNGFAHSNIITMIADVTREPYTNEPPEYIDNRKVDYFRSLDVHYAGPAVNEENLAKVLKGDKTGPGKTWDSNENSNVMIYFSGEATNISLFIGENEVYAAGFRRLISDIRAKGKYKNMYVVMESPNAEFLLKGMDLDALNVYAISPAYGSCNYHQFRSPLMHLFTEIWREATEKYVNARLVDVTNLMKMSVRVEDTGAGDTARMAVASFIPVPKSKSKDNCPCCAKTRCWCRCGVPQPIVPAVPRAYGFPQNRGPYPLLNAPVPPNRFVPYVRAYA